MFSPGSVGDGNSGYAQTDDHGRVQWGMTSNGVAIFHVAQINNKYVVFGIEDDGSDAEQIDKTPTAEEFRSAVAWITIER